MPYGDLAPFLKDFLEGEGTGQKANFFARFQPKTQNESQFGEGLFNDYLSKYGGALGQQALRGEDPNLTWGDFLDQNFNFGRDILRASPERTGRFTSRLAGPARWLTNQ